MKSLKFYALLILIAFLGSSGQVWAQYTLNEMGANFAVGAVHYQNGRREINGAGVHANGFYGHYFCGKRYGIQAQAGLAYMLGSMDVRSSADQNRTFVMHSVQAELAFFFKVRRHDYHRRKEWAFMVGPVVPVPVVQRYRAVASNPVQDNSGPLTEVYDLNYFAPRMQASFRFRRPVGENSFFIEPGVQIGLLPEFGYLNQGASFRRWEVFLSLGYSFWDRRG